MTTIGQPVTLVGQFKNGDDDNPLELATAKATVVPPTGSSVDVDADGQDGTWTATYTPTSAGLYQFYFTGRDGSDVVLGVTTVDVFNVEPNTTTALISLNQAKTQLAKNKNTSVDDDAILGYIRSASDIVNTCCGYTAPTVITETVSGRVDASGRSTLVLSKGPVLSVTSITNQMQGLPITDTTALVINANSGTVYLSNWFAFYGPLTVSYVAGRPGAVPQVLQDACALLVKWLWDTRRGGAAATPSQGGDEVVMYMGIEMPQRVAALLSMSPYTAAPGIA